MGFPDDHITFHPDSSILRRKREIFPPRVLQEVMYMDMLSHTSVGMMGRSSIFGWVEGFLLKVKKSLSSIVRPHF